MPPSPTPTPLIVETAIEVYGFNLTVDGDVDYESSGLVENNASIDEGVIFFEHGGANVILLWFNDTDSDLDAIIVDNYTSLTESQTDLTFATISEGYIEISSQTGQYLAFVTETASGDTQGGIIGSWRCPLGTAFSLTATGADATVVQIRFKRLLDSFTCAQ